MLAGLQVLLLSVLCVYSETVHAALRLRADGGQLIDPSGKPIVLTGFNWVLASHHIHEGEGKFMKSIQYCQTPMLSGWWGFFGTMKTHRSPVPTA